MFKKNRISKEKNEDKSLEKGKAREMNSVSAIHSIRNFFVPISFGKYVN